MDKSNLRNYQRRFIKFTIDQFNRGEGVAGWLDMGLGKTASTLYALKWLFDDAAITRVLIIAPKFVAEHTWPEEIGKWDELRRLKYNVAVGDAVHRMQCIRTHTQITMINRENVEWLIASVKQYKRWPFDVIVIDEASDFKSADSKRFRALRRVIKAKKPFVIELTGTPAGNGYMDIWSQIFLLDGGKRLYDGIMKYRTAFFNAIKQQWGTQYELRPQSPADIQEKLRDLVMVMQSEDYLELPELVETVVEVDLPASARAIYDEMKKSMYIALQDDSVRALSGASLMNKLQQIASGKVYNVDKEPLAVHTAKLDRLDDIISEAAGKPVMVAYVFQHERDAIFAKYKKRARTISTAQDIKDWNAGRIPILVVHPASIGHGLNLQFGGHILVWYSLPWSLELYKQTIKRLHRSGQVSEHVYMHLLVVRNSVDQRIAATLTAKDLSQDILLKALKG